MNREEVFEGDAPEEYLEYRAAVENRDNAKQE